MLASPLPPRQEETLSSPVTLSFAGSAQERRSFIREDTLVNNDDPRETLRSPPTGPGFGWHQRKLTLSLLYFFTLFWDPETLRQPKIVYAGAAPGRGLEYITRLPGFTSAEWHLYDPAPFSLRPGANVRIYRESFNDGIARAWSQRDDVLFLSDFPPGGRYDEIVRHHQDQERWHRIIGPVASSLLFRPPLPDAIHSNDFDYLHGYVLKQPWMGRNSTETRLVPYGDSRYVWDVADYSALLAYHNATIRSALTFDNPYLEDYRPILPPDLLNDFDSRYETQIWIEYLAKFRGQGLTTNTNVSFYVQGLTKHLGGETLAQRRQQRMSED